MNAIVQKRYFTVEEANQRLPLVKRIVGDIVQLYGEINERRERLIDIRQRSGSTGSSSHNMYGEEVDEMEREVNKDIDSYKEYLDELTGLDIELKDPEKGLIDFLSIQNDREVYLCWQLGEEEIGFWHELGAGFSGRQSLLEILTPHSPEEEEEEQ